MQNLLSVEQAAEKLGLSSWTVYRMARAGRIGSVRIGKRRLFSEDDLEQFVKETRAGSCGDREES